MQDIICLDSRINSEKEVDRDWVVLIANKH